LVQRAEPKKGEKVRVPPESMIVIQLDEIAGRLADQGEILQKVLTHLQETTAEGVDIPFKDTTVTGTTLLHFVKDYPYHLLRSLDMLNKGPGTAYYRVNEDAKEVEVEDRESVRIERPKATIEYMTLRVDAGQSTTVQLTGHY